MSGIARKHPRAGTSTRSHLGLFLLLCLIGVLCHMGDFEALFSSDDFTTVYKASSVSPANLSGFLHYLFNAGGDHVTPIGTLVRYLSWVIAGDRAWILHTFNVILHAINSYLVYCLARTFHIGRLPAVLSAISFSTTVVHHNTVFWITCVTYLLACCAILLSMLSYISFVKSGKLSLGFAAIVFQGTAMLIATTGIQMPLIFITLTFFIERNQILADMKQRRLIYAGSLAATICFIALHLLVKWGKATTQSALSLDRLFTGIIQAAISPFYSLAKFFSIDSVLGIQHAMIATGLIILLIAIYYMFTERKVTKYLLGVGTLLVLAVCSYLPFGVGRSDYAESIGWDRGHYIPNATTSILLVVLIWYLTTCNRRRFLRYCATALILGFVSLNAEKSFRTSSMRKDDTVSLHQQTLRLCQAIKHQFSTQDEVSIVNHIYHVDARYSGWNARIGHSAPLYCGWLVCGHDCVKFDETKIQFVEMPRFDSYAFDYDLVKVKGQITPDMKVYRKSQKPLSSFNAGVLAL